MSQDTTSPTVRNEGIDMNTWLRLGSAGNYKIKWGITDSNNGSSWGLASEITSSIAHGAGTTPVWGIAVADTGTMSPNADDVIHCAIRSIDATNINIRLKSSSGSTGNFPGVSIYWAVIYT